MDPRGALEDQVKVAIIRCLRMSITADELHADMPLFGDGFGLDSIDIRLADCGGGRGR